MEFTALRERIVLPARASMGHKRKLSSDIEVQNPSTQKREKIENKEKDNSQPKKKLTTNSDTPKISKKDNQKNNVNTNTSTTKPNLKTKKPNTKSNTQQAIEKYKTKKTNGHKKETTKKKEKQAVIPLDSPLFPGGAPNLSENTELRAKLEEKLKSSQFRYLNEQLYTMTGSDAEALFKKNPELPNIYHMGYRRQVAQWPLNPLSKIIDRIKSMPTSHVVADFGCGDAQLALSLPTHTVHSFDLHAANPRVIQCEMSHVPLADASVDVVVFCLSLMGTNFKDYIIEANRVMKVDGILLIAEVRSRFDNLHDFIVFLIEAGFLYDKSNKRNKMFVWFEFHKKNRGYYSSKERATALLKPCKYKKR